MVPKILVSGFPHMHLSSYACKVYAYTAGQLYPGAGSIDMWIFTLTVTLDTGGMETIGDRRYL